MMTAMAWFVYCGVVAAILTSGAFAWEHAARWSGRPARWGWAAAITGSVSLPWLLRLVPERTWQEVLPAALPAFPVMPAATASLEPVGMVGSDVVASSYTAVELAVIGWAAASVLMLAYVCWAVMRLAVARRRWRAAELDGDRVFLSEDMGPAALGLGRGVVVVPAWVLELREELRRLLLAHEREHVRAGDPRLLFLGLLCAAAMPWNPLVWVQMLRLRNAIELDCDARVLREGVDPRAYGRLLLEVGRRRSSGALVMATFAEPRVFLEERIRRIARWPLQRSRGRAMSFSVLAVLLFAAALSARDPLRAGTASGVQLLPMGSAAEPVAQPAVTMSPGGHLIFTDMPPLHAVDPDAPDAPDAPGAPSPAALRMAVDTPPPPPPPPAPGRRVEEAPTFTPMTVRPELRNSAEVVAALQAAYPPLLRDAGIGGTPVVWFFINTDGRVLQARLSRSSGYPALDEAALQVAGTMTFSPAMNRDQVVSVWVEIPLVFDARRPDEREAAQRAYAERAAAVERAAAERAAAVERAAAAVPAGAIRIRPELRNAEEVVRALVRTYPPLLRDAGIGGTAVVWFYVGDDGRVLRTQLAMSSGQRALDEAAISVASVMSFSPARLGAERVATWVELPISFGGAPIPLMERGPDVTQLTALVVQGVRAPAAAPAPPPAPAQAPARPGQAAPAAQPVPAGLESLARQPVFTPMTVRPQLSNQAEVSRALVRNYPPVLRDAGIGGTPVIWFLVDAEGRVVRTQVSRSSGYAALDEAALNVAAVMQFTPALNRDQRVPVWVEVPIVFTAR
jgi:TonB family protein